MKRANYNNVSLMSLTADQAKLELNKLIDNSKIQYFNNFVTLPNDTKSYWYNQGHELSKKYLNYFHYIIYKI